MSTFGIIFWLIMFFCIGAFLGGLIERWLGRRSTSQVLPPSESTVAKEGDLEVLRAWRNPANKVWLEMDGKRLEAKEALGPEQRQRLVNLLLDLRPWLDTTRPATPVASQAPQQAAAVSPMPAPAVPDKDKTKAKEATPSVQITSIVEQIDAVLQTKLLSSPFKDRKIGLVEGPGGMVIVQDGANRYEGIDAVPDPEVKALIRLAVSDWEKGMH
ncbi:MAG TPA: hypothetical protein VMC09_18530 [Anaerolineales bacterium]|nr:hypothetical protein [Anaerolineales bacterium]